MTGVHASPMRDDFSDIFIHALDTQDLEAVRSVPKSDLHNHGTLGMRYASLRRISRAVPPPPAAFAGLGGFFRWTSGSIRSLARDPVTLPLLLRASIEDAIADGVTILEMSFDLGAGRILGPAPAFARLAAGLRDEYADRIRLRPEIGLKKAACPAVERDYLLDLINSGVFDAIDLYGREVFPLFLGIWCGLYRRAGNRGLKLKAHLGEHEPPLGLPFAADRLGLSAIQHGITFTRSARAAAWAREHRITFNVCPASNIALGNAASWETHPIRKMFDDGLRVTIATDDLLAFGMSVSEQYIELRRRGVFNSEELDRIRLEGLAS